MMICCNTPLSLITHEVVELFDERERRDLGSGLTAHRLLSDSSDDFEAVLNVLTRSFGGVAGNEPEPCYDWCYTAKEPTFTPLTNEQATLRRERFFRWFCKICLYWGLRREGIYYVTMADAGGAGKYEVVSVAVTAPPGSPPSVNTFEQLSLMWQVGLPPWTDGPRGASARVDAMESILSKVHDSYYPEHEELHLLLLGSEPSRQGQGIGSATLRLIADIADADNVDVYLETLGEHHEQFYEKRGYTLQCRCTVGHNGNYLESCGGVAAMIRPAAISKAGDIRRSESIASSLASLEESIRGSNSVRPTS